MKTLIALITIALLPLASHAASTQPLETTCYLTLSSVKDGRTLDWTKLRTIKPGEENNFEIAKNATMSVKPYKVCGSDGGPCGNNFHLHMEITLKDTTARTDSGESVLNLSLVSGDYVLRGTCMPDIH